MAPDVDPGVRLIAEGSGDLIGLLPGDACSLAPNDEVVYGLVGEAAVTYKVEKVQYVAEHTSVSDPPNPDRYSVYGMTDLIVSVVS